MRGICEVCGNETIVAECQSTFFPEKTIVSCRKCQFDKIEPYQHYIEVIADCYDYDLISEKWRNNFETKILPIFKGKTLKQVKRDSTKLYKSRTYEYFFERSLKYKGDPEEFSEKWRAKWITYVLEPHGKTWEEFLREHRKAKVEGATNE